MGKVARAAAIAAGAFLGTALAVLDAKRKNNTRPRPRKRFYR